MVYYGSIEKQKKCFKQLREIPVSKIAMNGVSVKTKQQYPYVGDQRQCMERKASFHV